MSHQIILLGKNGQVGWELQRSLASIANIESFDRNRCNLAQTSMLQSVLSETPHSVIVNAAAYTSVDKAESESTAAFKINAEATGVLANAAAKANALLVHFSTDYVFDGKNAFPYTEKDTTAPLSVYGESKARGEKAIINSGCRYLILRTSWVYGLHGRNFAKTILQLASQNNQVSVVADQFGAPTSAELIADVTAMAIRDVLAGRAPGGIYHLTASGETSWHGYANFVLDRARALGISLRTYQAERISSREYPVAATRPANSRLDTTKLQNTFGLTMPDWRYHLARTIQQIAENY